jgi:undecaprenyl-diphosphatase
LASFLPLVLIGFVIAGLVGYFVIRWFLGFLKTRSMLPFALYCGLLSVAVLLIMGIR